MTSGDPSIDRRNNILKLLLVKPGMNVNELSKEVRGDIGSHSTVEKEIKLLCDMGLVTDISKNKKRHHYHIVGTEKYVSYLDNIAEDI